MRASGFSLKQIIFPIALAALLVSYINFFISSELTTRSRIATKQILAEQSIPNPIQLLKKQNFSTMKTAFVDLTPSQDEHKVNNVWLIQPSKGSKRLNIFHAEELEMLGKTLNGKNISFFTHFESPKTAQFDSLLLENQREMHTSAKDLSKLLKTSHWSLNPVHLPLSYLLVRKELSPGITPKELGTSVPVEITKRFAFGLSAFTFTFLGIAFGMELGRRHSKKNLFKAVILAGCVLLGFIVGKSFKYDTFLGMTVYIAPQLIALLASAYAIKKISGGHE